MSYLVLARKWRPKNFAEVAGQEHVVRTLTNALQLDRLHHAYMFTGTRGTGKTTIARILARCLNCVDGPTATPCGVCDVCQAIDNGSFVDLIEIDAASNTGVDDMRELLETTQYAPSSGRYKIYLIDEVHMLSKNSFNALLKTLEEPPPNIQFLFATTDPQKVPMTILSRCLQLNLTRIPNEVIAAHLQKILDSEGIESEERGLAEIVIAAQGSMRDALSLLDQAISYGNGKLETAVVNDMFGTNSRQQVCEVLRCIKERDAQKMSETIDALYLNATDFAGFVDHFIDMLHQIALRQAVPQSRVAPQFDEQDVEEFAQALAPEDVQIAYQTAIIGKRDMSLVGDDRNAVEMIMLRIMNFVPLGSHQASTRTTGTQASTPRPAPRQATEQQATKPKPAQDTKERQVQIPPRVLSTKDTKERRVQIPPRVLSKKGAPQAAAKDNAEQTSELQLDAEPQEEQQAELQEKTPTAGNGKTGGYDLNKANDVNGWIELLDAIALEGPEYAICENARLNVLSSDSAQLLIGSRYIGLCDEKSLSTINEKLNAFVGFAVKLEVAPADEDNVQTPAEVRVASQQKQEKQRKEAINSDPAVSLLKEEFDASIVADN